MKLNPPTPTLDPETLPFPWTRRDGVTRTLREPALWAAVFTGRPVRTCIKNAAKDALGIKGVAYTDDLQIGEAALQLLATEKSRGVLFRELRRLNQPRDSRPILATRLRSVFERQDRRMLPTCVHRNLNDRFYLDLGQFEIWLEDAQASSWGAEELLIATVPFAILQPADAGAMARALLVRKDVAEQLASEAFLMPPVDDELHEQKVAEPYRQLDSVADAVEAPSAVAVTPSVTDSPRTDPLANLAARAQAAIEAKERAQAAMASGDLDRGHRELKEAVDSRDALRSEFAAALTREGISHATISPEIPQSALASAVGAGVWLDAVRALMKEADEHRRASIQDERTRLCQALADAGLPIPQDLEEAATIEQLALVRDREEARLKLERTWHQLLRDQDPSGILQLEANQRLMLVCRLLEQNALPSVALTLFAQDLEVRKACPLERLGLVAAEHMLSAQSLPVGFWPALFERIGAGIVGFLDAHGLSDPDLIRSQDPILAAEFEAVIEAVDLSTEHALYPWLTERRISRLTPAERISALGELVLSSSEGRWSSLLVDALAQSDRFAEAVLIAAAAMRRGRLADASDLGSLRDALLRLLIDAVDYENRHEVLRNVLLSSRELVSDADSLVVMLFVAAVVEPTLVDTLLYQYGPFYEEALARHRALVEDWLLRVRVGRLSRESVRSMEERLALARREFVEWAHDLDRKSSYTNWPPAAEYQRHIANWLRRLFAELARTGALPPATTDSEALIDGLAQTHDLTAAEGPARRNMLTHIADQLKRLQLFGAVAAGLPDSRQLDHVLSGPQRRLQDTLLEESRSAHGLTRVLYNVALREMDL